MPFCIANTQTFTLESRTRTCLWTPASNLFRRISATTTKSSTISAGFQAETLTPWTTSSCPKLWSNVKKRDPSPTLTHGTFTTVGSANVTNQEQSRSFQDPATWISDILQPWNEEIDHTIDILIYLVRPKPPCTPMECMLAHLIIEQAPRPDWTVVLVTIQDASFRGATVNHKAFSTSSLMNARTIIRLAKHAVSVRCTFL